jgi:hypothetical protein
VAGLRKAVEEQHERRTGGSCDFDGETTFGRGEEGRQGREKKAARVFSFS